MNSASHILNDFLDLIYPPKCLVCGELNPLYICAECVARIQPVARPYCRICGHTLLDYACRDCDAEPRSFALARAAGQYSGVLRDAIHQFKYNGHRMLADPLASLLCRYLDTQADFPSRKSDLLIPVPIHSSRRRLRGYNQSELLASRLSEMVGIPAASDILVRTRRTKPQVECTPEERRTNLHGAFSVRCPPLPKGDQPLGEPSANCPPSFKGDRLLRQPRGSSDAANHPNPLAGKTILLIDDVATTCSTVQECSRSLIESGAARVYVLCLAFGS